MHSNDSHQKPNNTFIWILVGVMLFSSFALVWLKKDDIINYGREMGLHTANPTYVDKNGKGPVEPITTTTEEISESKLKDTKESIVTIPEVVKTSISLEERYAELPEGQTYTIYQYEANQIQDRFVNRAFEVMIQRLISENKFYSTVDYELTVYPTLDSNIFNLRLDEIYSDGTSHQGHYSFDYKAKEVSKY